MKKSADGIKVSEITQHAKSQVINSILNIASWKHFAFSERSLAKILCVEFYNCESYHINRTLIRINLAFSKKTILLNIKSKAADQPANLYTLISAVHVGSISGKSYRLPHFSRMDLRSLIIRISLFPILAMFGGIFHFFFQTIIEQCVSKR